ncbi:MAG: hypothetical protein PHH48_08585 [Eubacteriales bacterium]|nr:hypothetical protein [Eubacteriales bacterium]
MCCLTSKITFKPPETAFRQEGVEVCKKFVSMQVRALKVKALLENVRRGGKNMFRRSLASLMAIVMVLVGACPVFAQTEQTEKVVSIKAIEEQLYTLAEEAYGAVVISDIKVNDSNLSYKMFYKEPNVTESHEYSIQKDGRIKLICSDGEITNVLIIDPETNTMYLDGNLVKVEDITEYADLGSTNTELSVGTTTMYRDSPIRGSSRDYNEYVSKTQKNLTYSTMLGNITYGAVATMLLQAFGIGGLIAYFATTIAILIKDQASPYSRSGLCTETIDNYTKPLTYPDIKANRHQVLYYDTYQESYIDHQDFYSLMMYV